MAYSTRTPQFIADVALAWRLLTVIPLPFIADEPHPAPGRAAGYFPLVGLILGLILVGANWIFQLFLPGAVAAALVVAVWAGLTGLLHLDGFMDSCDGLLPPRDPAHRLEIMKDSRVGAFGVVGAILLLLVKFIALVALPASSRLPALIAAPVLARWAMTWAMARYPLARSEGLGVLFKTGLGWLQVGLASVVGMVVPLLLLGWPGLLLVAVAWLTTFLVARLAMARIAGLTGDVYGAICEVGETVALLGVIVLPD
ncbi:MAG: adenosylcobinamide-GDP ribazoletransferase [Anaerolineae bacterium]|nr:adenosylcobinamide-GDP ribazoletransferase [Anaerolineae bacterium]